MKRLTGPVLDALMGIQVRSEQSEPAQETPASAPVRSQYDPPSGPARPTSAREMRIVQKGIETGFPAGRHGVELEKCPYRLDERPRWLWYVGVRIGERAGREELATVLDSYHAGLESIDAGPPRAPWR